MNSRDSILSAIKSAQPLPASLPVVPDFAAPFSDLTEKFKTVLSGLGGRSFDVSDDESIITLLRNEYPDASRVVSVLPGLISIADGSATTDPRSLENVDVAIIQAKFAVAENGSVWVTDQNLIERALPFITQHLVVLIDQKEIVATMHDAYRRIGDEQYGFGTFIAGPSKTADIEQSLVLGAHGARSMTILLKV